MINEKEKDSPDKIAFYKSMFDGGHSTAALWESRKTVYEFFHREPLYKIALKDGVIYNEVYDEAWRLNLDKLRSMGHLMDPMYDGIESIVVSKNYCEDMFLELANHRIDGGAELMGKIIEKHETDYKQNKQLKFNF